MNAQQNLVAAGQQSQATGVQNHRINEEQTPLIGSPQAASTNAEHQSPPPFLSGIPLVNPGNFAVPSAPHEQTPPQLPPQQTMSHAQSMVSNMATYSSSKFYL